MSINIYAGGRLIIVDYNHSRRIAHNEINIELASENNFNNVFYARLFTKDLGQENENSIIIERTISIDKEYFDTMYNRILDLNFREIVETYENRVGGDGYNVSITVGTRQSNIKITLWSPDFLTTESRKLGLIIYEIYALFDMEEWL